MATYVNIVSGNVFSQIRLTINWTDIVLFIKGVLWHSPRGNLTKNAQDISPQ